MKPYRFSLTFIILSSLTLLLLLTWFLVSLISFKTAENDLIYQKNEEGRILLASFTSLYSAKIPDSERIKAIEHFAQRLSSFKSFAGLTVIDDQSGMSFRLKDKKGRDGQLNEVLKNGLETYRFFGHGLFVSRYAPIVREGKTVGAARLTLTLQAEYGRLSTSRHIFLAYFILDFFLLLCLGSYLLSRFIVVPIRKLLTATERIAAGDFEQRVSVPGGAEIADLAGAFNRMVDALREKRNDVDRHVKSLEEMNRELHSARLEVIRSEKMASVGLLAAGTAHEIGTPLSAIMGYAGILHDEFRDDPVKADYLKRIEAESERIDRIVRGLLDYARPNPSVFDETDVAQVISSTLEMLEQQGALKSMEKRLEIENGLSPVYADSHQLRQVFTNLVINARDAMPDGGLLIFRAGMCAYRVKPGGFSLQALGAAMGKRKGDFGGVFMTPFRENEMMVKIEIIDNGKGIEPENLERIFDPFFTTKEPGQGTGLGLAISARIIDSFGGRITVESEAGKGSCFTVWLHAIKRESSI
jgi:two-component system NtrC family sensor kinase